MIEEIPDLRDQAIWGVLSALLQVGVGYDPGGQVGAAVLTAHSDDRNLRKSTADNRQQLKAGHLGKVEVTNDDVGKRLLHHSEGLETIVSAAHGVAEGTEEFIRDLTKNGVIVDDQHAVIELSRHEFGSYVGSAALRPDGFADILTQQRFGSLQDEVTGKFIDFPSS